MVDLPNARLQTRREIAVAVMIADEVRGKSGLVNVVDPGWVRTRIGGSGARRPIEQGG
jgi:hypothetical protein